MKFKIYPLYIFSNYCCVCLFATEIGNYRLPTDVIPSHYSIKIRPYIEEEFFEGEVSIYVRSRNTLDKITLHSSELNITEALINRIAARFEYEDNEKLTLRYANDSIQPGEHILYIKYRSTLSRNGVGFLKAPFTYNGEEGYLLVTDFEPTGARKAFPCFDEPAFKSKFSIRLVAPDDTYTAISNMPEINRFTTSYGVIYDFATTVTMSTYLVSFAITKYPYYEDILEENERKLPIRIYTFNASEANNEFATNCTKRAIQFYSEYTNTSYPLSKLDMIEYNRPQSAATENWGLITFREGLLTLGLGKYDELQIKTVMYHELAHFWFGNLVTNDWWNDIWLQEGFATYMSYKLYTKERANKVKEPRSFFFNGFLETDKTVPVRPIVDYLVTQKLLEHRFDDIVYEKGASVFLMIESVIGEEVFQQVVRTFLKRYAYKTATTNSFISIIEELVPHLNMRDFIESYLYQNRFPLVRITGSNGIFVLEQEVCATSANFTTSGQKWTLPITYITNVNRTPTLTWFDKDMEHLTIAIPDARWILLNKENIGIYRVTFSVELWKTLIADFQALSLEESNSVVNEAVYSFKFGLIDCSVMFDLMKNVKYNKQWIFFIEFHDIIKDGLTCSGYKKELEIYINFLHRRFNETNFLRRRHIITEENCLDTKDLINSEKNNFDLDTCARWIKDNLSPNSNSNDIVEN